MPSLFFPFYFDDAYGIHILHGKKSRKSFVFILFLQNPDLNTILISYDCVR